MDDPLKRYMSRFLCRPIEISPQENRESAFLSNIRTWSAFDAIVTPLAVKKVKFRSVCHGCDCTVSPLAALEVAETTFRWIQLPFRWWWITLLSTRDTSPVRFRKSRGNAPISAGQGYRRQAITLTSADYGIITYIHCIGNALLKSHFCNSDDQNWKSGIRRGNLRELHVQGVAVAWLSSSSLV